LTKSDWETRMLALIRDNGLPDAAFETTARATPRRLRTLLQN
jgi:hypothetical protein